MTRDFSNLLIYAMSRIQIQSAFSITKHPLMLLLAIHLERQRFDVKSERGYDKYIKTKIRGCWYQLAERT